MYWGATVSGARGAGTLKAPPNLLARKELGRMDGRDGAGPRGASGPHFQHAGGPSCHGGPELATTGGGPTVAPDTPPAGPSRVATNRRWQTLESSPA